MEYRKLGKTDLDVSVICLGTMTWGNQNTEEDGHAQMDYALSQGVNFWDTAEIYAVPASPETSFQTEIIIGNWFKKNPGKRKDVVLATKIAGPGPYTTHIREASDYPEENIRTAVEGSLKRLQTDYLDLYQLHWPARVTNFFGKRGYRHKEGWEDTFLQRIETLNSLVKDGKIRHWGISNESSWGFSHYMRLCEAHGFTKFVSVQNPYSLLNRLYEVGLAEQSIRDGAGLLAYSPMAFGLLSGKYHKGIDKPSDRINKFEGMSRYNSDNCHLAAKQYIEIAEKHGMTPAQMSLAFVNQQDFVTSNIIGATNLDQLKENIASIDIKLSKEVLKEIEAIHAMIPNPAP
jgi:aryl-alcohol dehydrogenase-like predicted oxidoreductase